jgi:glycosyltransferase involved in cell wall biosynthesis
VRALYGCTAHHWGYAIQGLSSLGLDTDLVRPYEVSPGLASALSRPGVPSKVRSVAARRAGRTPSPGISLGIGELVLPAFIHTGTPIRPVVRRSALDLQARRFARRAHSTPTPRLVQFTDGLGHRLRRDRLPDATIVCERRNLHHAAFTVDLDPCLDLPYVPLDADPVESFLEQEYALADLIHVYSDYAAQTFVDHGIPRDRLMVAPLPAPAVRATADLAGSLGARSGFLYVGRVEAVKGIDLAVAATQLAGVRLVVAGGATESVRRWLAGFPHVTYVGVADRARLDRLMAEAIALVMPSYESYGLVLLEAAAAGLPVLASDTAGASEYLGLSELGLEVGRRDPDSWAAAICRVAEESPAWREHVVTALGQSLATLDETACARRYADALVSAVPALARETEA